MLPGRRSAKKGELDWGSCRDGDEMHGGSVRHGIAGRAFAHAHASKPSTTDRAFWRPVGNHVALT